MKRVVSILIVALLIFSFTACSQADKGSSAPPSAISSTASAVSSEPASELGSSAVSEESVTPDVDTPIRVVALKGPTAMGMVEMMDKDYYEFTLVSSPDEITPLIAQGKVDIAAVPANLAAVLYAKTEGAIRAIEINTLGVLYIVENGDTVTSVEDLKGKTIFASGKGATPEYALNYMLTANGIDPETDVTIEYKSEHAECVSALTSTENAVAMLPQPFVTTAMTKDESIKVVLDLTEEWEKAAGDGGSAVTLVTGVTVVQNTFLTEHPELVELFVKEHAASVKSVNADPESASVLMEQYDIVPAAVAVKAIPECNITCITGSEMTAKLEAYLSVLLEQNPQSVGGSLPDEALYYEDLTV